ncbi:MAG: ABC transporter permease [Candidatus Pseudobacter hemicellulosilyticus]|uniref:ABC transporter permease n=1 Tax=Candidatus Pseudobacter hemicellulosilyticus TaxID=3121375 RepID=A0AAJ6BG20_9BACT|nr:MAG: ABC transporter permease [Pseudobacter sp.]
MIKNYLKVAWRSLLKNKGYSAINILGLAVGMAVVMLIGLWIHDELTFDKSHDNYDRLGKIMTTQTFNGETGTGPAVNVSLGRELETSYTADFKNISMASWNNDMILGFGDKKLIRSGMWVQPVFPDMLSLKMIAGARSALKDPSSILLSASVASALFNTDNPIGKTIKLNNETLLTVGGVYEDLPKNTSLRETWFLLPWEKYLQVESWVKNSYDHWGNHSWQLFVQLQPNLSFEQVSEKIRLVSMKHLDPKKDGQEELIIHPMRQWHLYGNWTNGKVDGGRIRFVWLFGIIGVFVLLLACINFMNLGTARSEKRAKEVGIRKTVGSERKQLIGQFLVESILVSLLSFILALLFVLLTLPWFNGLSDKQMSILWTEPLFWAGCLGFSLLTGLVAGSYPAFYLSSFQPIKVLKGTFKAGRYAAIPRKVLVVIQFTVSVALIICTIVVFRQISYAKDRPVGYTREGLLMFDYNTSDIRKHYDALKTGLLNTGVIDHVTKTSSSITAVWSNQIGFSWKGMTPGALPLFGVIAVSQDYGKTIGWHIRDGRDFSKEFASDSLALVLNESAVKLMGLQQPVGENVKWGNDNYTIIGVINDMVMQSPYEPIMPTIFFINEGWANKVLVKVKPGSSMRAALDRMEPLFRQFNPGSPFEFKFVDEDYARKFESEERIGKLAGFFAVLAIFISCLGIFGLASFVAEQRTKEIGVRRVLGASIYHIWELLSKDFVLLVMISFLLAAPLAWYFMHQWLNDYKYRTSISWWIFAISCGGALLITLVTVSFQAIKAALTNPVKNLRSE